MSEREVLWLDGIPVYQNKMFRTESEARACPRGNLVLVQDEDSGLIYNRAFDPTRLSDDESYQNERCHSLVFRGHPTQVLDTIDRHFRAMSILEIGCGKGAFLELLLAAGYDARGIDPAYDGDSHHIVRGLFEPGLDIRRNAIVMRHVLSTSRSQQSFLTRAQRKRWWRSGVH